jgi:hypothetical protein
MTFWPALRGVTAFQHSSFMRRESCPQRTTVKKIMAAVKVSVVALEQSGIGPVAVGPARLPAGGVKGVTR